MKARNAQKIFHVSPPHPPPQPPPSHPPDLPQIVVSFFFITKHLNFLASRTSGKRDWPEVVGKVSFITVGVGAEWVGRVVGSRKITVSCQHPRW